MSQKRSIQELLKTHDIAEIQIANMGLLEAGFQLRSSTKGFAVDIFGGRNPTTETKILIDDEGIQAVKDAINADTDKGQRFLATIEEYQARLAETAEINIEIQEPLRTEISIPYIQPHAFG